MPAAPTDPEGLAGDASLDLLTGPAAADLLSAALATSGGELLDWSARQVDHRPGASTTVSYRAQVQWPDGARTVTLGASTGLRTLQADIPGMLVLSDGGQQVAVWQFPADPGLPALATAFDQAAMRALLASYGVQAGPLDLMLRSYRPRRRAVVEVRGAELRLFVKVLRPSRVAELHHRHRLLHDAGVPVPRSLGWTDDGMLLLGALPGHDLRSVLRAGGVAPDPDELNTLLDRFPRAVCALPRRASWSDNVGHYAAVVGSVLPQEAGRAAQLAAEIASRLDETSGGDEATHGDFYETQILVEGPRVTGLLDVDTAGPGRRADDLACLVAHTALLAMIEPAHAPATSSLTDRLFARFSEQVDPLELRARVAGVLISLATGPHRVQQPSWRRETSARLDLAQSWLDGVLICPRS